MHAVECLNVIFVTNSYWLRYLYKFLELNMNERAYFNVNFLSHDREYLSQQFNEKVRWHLFDVYGITWSRANDGYELLISDYFILYLVEICNICGHSRIFFLIIPKIMQYRSFCDLKPVSDDIKYLKICVAKN